MGDLVDMDVALVQDLIDLEVVCVGIGRLNALINEHGAALNCDSDVLQRRLDLLRKLSQTLPAPPYDPLDAEESEDSELGGEQTEEKDEAVLYVKYDLVYGTGDEGADALTDVENEDATQGVTNAAVSNSFFSELFPTKEVTPQRHLPGSFPDIADFAGGIDFVGSGFSGLVFKSTLRGVPVVLKVSRAKSEKANRADYNEWSVSDRLKKHPNVLQVVGLCPSFEHPFHSRVGTTAIISPWQENGALRTFYDSETRTRKDDDLQNVALGMIRGIRSLHEQGVVHRDIAVRNFLVDIDGRVMLCDFGLTKFIPEGEECIDTRKMPEDALLPWKYLAPESFNKIFSTKSDMWMFGISLFELVKRTTPWPELTKPSDFRKAMESRKLELPNMDDFPPIISAIVRDCLQFEASMRPSANDVVERLVRWQFRDMDLNRDENGNTILHQLAASGDSAAICRLLESEKPVMINALNHLGETPLMLAQESSDIFCQFQYRKVPSGNEEPSGIPECFHNIDFFGTLNKLAQKQDIQQIKQIFVAILKPLAKRYILPFEWRSLMVKLLGGRGGSNGDTPLHTAAKVGNIALLDALLKFQGFDMWKSDNEGRTALHIAALHGHSIIMGKLMALTDLSEEKQDGELLRVNSQDKTGKTPLHLAAASGNVSAVRVLLNCNTVNVNLRDFDERVPMFDVTLANTADGTSGVELLQAFVEHPDIDLYAKDSADETILHKLSRLDLARSAEFLLQRADVDMFGREKGNGFAPIHLFVRENSFEVAGVLFSRGNLDVNDTDKYGNTLLHILAAASINPTDIPRQSAMRSFAETLLSRDDIDLNLCNSRGDSPLHVAIEKNNLTVIEAFVCTSGGRLRINQCDKKLRTPLALALHGVKTDIAKMILSRSDVDVTIVDSAGQTPLYLACHNNMSVAAQMILSKSDVDVTYVSSAGQTPLHHACYHNMVVVAQTLLSRDGVDVNARDADHETPFHFACRANATEVAAMLISRDDVDVNDQYKHHKTPLHFASSGNAAEVAAMLLSRSIADVNARDNYQRTPLLLACEYNSTKVAILLISRDDVDVNDQDKNHQTPLHFASLENATNVAAMLLSRDDVDVNARDKDGWTPLHNATLKNAAEVATMLLSRDDVDVNARDNYQETPLHRATYRNAVKVASILLSRHDVDVGARNSIGRTALHAACERRYPELAAMLVSRDDIDVNARDSTGKTALHAACQRSAAGIAAMLLSRDDVDTNARDKDRRTPLLLACERNATKVATLLISRDDVDVNARDKDRQTPLHNASHCNAAKVATLLISRDEVDVNAQDKFQQTPLHRASCRNATKVASVLLSRDDVDVNARDSNGQTVLHLACQGGYAKLAAMLLSRDNVDVGARDSNGKTALDVTLESPWPTAECAKLLRGALSQK